MKQEGVQRDHYWLNDHWQDAILIGMTEDDYRFIAKPKLEALIRSMGRGQ
jgi:GH25 family lysozyme M1 (1,4-beta-N-acetylmuramidase)